MGEGQCNTHYIEAQPQHRFGYSGSLAGQTETNRIKAASSDRLAGRKEKVKKPRQDLPDPTEATRESVTSTDPESSTHNQPTSQSQEEQTYYTSSCP